MIKSISWSDYFSTVAILLVIYYAAIAYLFFKTEILALIGIKILVSTNMSAVSVEEARQSFTKERNEDYMPKLSADVDLSPVIQSFKDEVSAYATSAAEEKPVKQEALYSIERIAAKYPVLNDTDCRNDLLEHISLEIGGALPSLFMPQDFRHLFLS